MKFQAVGVALMSLALQPNEGLVSSFTTQATGGSPSFLRSRHGKMCMSTATEGERILAGYLDVKKLSFRELHHELRKRELPTSGVTATLRQRLFESVCPNEDEEECEVPEVQAPWDDDINFTDLSDPYREFNEILEELNAAVAKGHWKSGTRKLKKLHRHHATPENPIPYETYVATLRACAADRLHGARASVPVRKIMEEMTEQGYQIPADLGNRCVQNTLGSEEGATHDGFGGIDTALAMLSAMESSPSGYMTITSDTYEAVVRALALDKSLDEALELMEKMIVERSYTPSMETLAFVATEANTMGNVAAPTVVKVLSFAKASGFDLDSIAHDEDGCSLLSNGVIAAARSNNTALGLRILAAASKDKACEPESGDLLVIKSSKLAARSSALLHKNAIDQAITDKSWKLAVKVLELIAKRKMTPSESILRKVTTLCAKCKKSRKATALLLDWVKLAKAGKVEKPSLSVFNIVVNACEICGEEELTLNVLETMRNTHETDGNVITFNIALKRLARKGQSRACEGIIIGMLEAEVEPTVVSYTTAIGACATDPKEPLLAHEWLKRMRSRNVKPNFHTYNTALAACMDGTLQGSLFASKIATEMCDDIELEMEKGFDGEADFNSVLPDSYTKVLAGKLLQQLRENWRNGDIDIDVAKGEVRPPLLKLVDFRKHKEWISKRTLQVQDEEQQDEEEANYLVVRADHRTAEI